MNLDIKNILRNFKERGGHQILDLLLRVSILLILIGILLTKGCNSKDSYIDQDIINKRKKVEKELDALLEMTEDIKSSQSKMDSLQISIYNELTNFENLLTENIYETDSTLIIIRNTPLDSILSGIPEYSGDNGGL
jgi:alpha-N-acetylglucosamine transferase